MIHHSPIPHDSRPILVGLDGSENSESAMWWAVDIAVESKRSLRLLTCYALPALIGMGVSAGYVGPMLSSEEHHRTALDLMKSKVLKTHPELEIEMFLDQGSPVLALLKAATDASMIVIGTKGVGSGHALLMGSVSYAIAHRAECPVVLVPETAKRTSTGRVVVGIDSSKGALDAADWALHFAEDMHRNLELISAWHYPYSAMSPEFGVMSGPDIDELRLAMLRDARKLVNRVKKHLSEDEGSRVSISAEVIEGSAADALVEHTTPQDILVVGSKSHSLIASVLLGSTAVGVAHRSKCPVVIVH
jgi:nucleotide-binding universal stress UspA family protein